MAEGDAVKVCVRVRPLIPREQGEQVNLLWQVNNNSISQVDGSRSFSFDRVFNSLETTSQVYQEVAVPIIHSALQGYNGTIFAYGQTSSGKTFTMMGTQDHLGIIPQAVKEIFRIIREVPTREFLLRVSYMEIYNETVTDLLCDDRRKKPLEVREDINRNVYVADLTEELVMIPEHVLQWIKKGEKNRHYGETKMNDHSSRSHTIFRMIVESRERNEPGNPENCDGAVMVSHLNLVDLAGSERASQTAAEGVRLKEGCNINRSLFVLGQVIKKLSDGQAGGFINYRDSKLTRILQNSLGGNTKTVIISTVTPVSLDETLSTLQFASTAKYVRNTPHVNEVLDDQALLKRYRKEIMDLKKQVEELEASSEIKAHAMAKEEHSQLLAEIKQLQKEKEDRIWNLRNIVVASSQQSLEEQKIKLKRRVTWAAEKLQNSLYPAGDSSFEMGSKTMSFAKRPKMCDTSSILEIDESILMEKSVFEDANSALDNFAQDATWNFESGVTCREKMSTSVIKFSSESASAQAKDSALLQKCNDLEQKVAELENELRKQIEEYQAEVCRREFLEKESDDLKHKLHSKDKDELEITVLSDRTETVPEGREQIATAGESLEMLEEVTQLKTAEEELEELNDSLLSNQTDGECQDPVHEQLAGHIHDLCREHIHMLEQKIADLEGNVIPENNNQTCLMESLQICEALIAEKKNAYEELAILQNNIDQLVNENESLKREKTDLEKCLQEKRETDEFEMLEKETQKEHEAQLIHEISNLKTLMQNAEVYNQELENNLANNCKVLKDQEQIIAQMKRESEMLQKKVRSAELLASMGDCEQLYDEVLQLKQSLSDAEAVTRDAQREAAFLRSENLELKEKMGELSVHCEKREKDASGSEKQLETEKSNSKRMQADLQKELQYAFNEINQLNGLLAGRVPKELLSRVELDKKVADYSKQLDSVLEEKRALEQENASLLEYKSLPGEIENLKDQLLRLQEEALQNANVHQELIQKKEDLEQGLISQKQEMNNLMNTVLEAKSTLQSLQIGKQEAELQFTSLQQQMDEITQERDELTTTKERLTLEMACLKDVEAELFSLRDEKSNIEKKLFNLEQHIEMMTSESDEVNATLQSLLSERDQLKEDLRENIEMSIETQDDLRKAQHDLQQQRQREEELTCQIASLEQKLLRLQEEALQNANVHQELIQKKEDLEQGQISQKQEMNNLMNTVLEAKSTLQSLQNGKQEAEQQLTSLQQQMDELTQERDELTTTKERLTLEMASLKEHVEMTTNERDEVKATLQSLLSERDQLKEDLRENIQMSIETPDDLRKAQHDLQQQRQREEELTRQIASLEQKLSSLEHELQKTFSVLKDSNNERGLLEETNQKLVLELEHLHNEIKNKESTVEETEKERAEADQTVLDLTVQLKTVSEEREKLEKQSAETQAELKRTQEELHQQKQGVEKLTNEMSLLEEKLLRLQEEALQNANVHQELIQKKEDLEQGQIGQKQEMNNLMNTVLEAKSTLQSLQNGKQEAEQQLTSLQQQMDELTQERDELTTTKERLTLEMASLKEHVEMMTRERDEVKAKLQSLLSERDQLKEDLRDNIQMSIETPDDLRKAQHDLQQQRQREEELTRQIASLEQKLLRLQEEALQNANVHQELIQKKEDLEQGQISQKQEMNNLMNTVLEAESTLQSLQNGKQEAEQQLTSLQQQMDELTQERDELTTTKERLTLEMASLKEHVEMTTNERDEVKATLQSLLSERDQLKEDLRENMQMSIETEDDLRKAQHDLQQQRQREEELTCQIASLEQKLSSLEHELQKTFSVLKDSNNERELLEETNQKLVLELEHLHNDIKNKESTVEETEKERAEVGQRVLDLTVQLKTVSEEREKLQKQSAETQAELKRTQEELHQQKQGVEKLTNEMSLLEEKLSSLERELQEKINILNKVIEDRHLFEQSKQELTSEMEQVMEDLKSKDSDLKQAEKERESASQKILKLANEMKCITQERDDLQNSKENLEEETKKLREEIQQLKHEHNIFADEQIRKTSQIDELETELQQMQEKIHLSDTSVKQLGNEKVALQKELHQYELKVASLHQELEQFQKLLERARSEKQHICASLQDQEKAVAQLQAELIASQTKPTAMKEECNESNIHPAEKVSEVNELLQEISSLQEQIQQWQQKVEDETMKNKDLCEEVTYLNRVVTAYHSVLNETEQVDELAACTETLERKDQEWKDLMEIISTVYENHKSLLKNLSSDHKREIEAQKQLMSAIKEGLSSTFSKAFGNLETEHIKLNSRMEGLLRRFKAIYSTAPVKVGHYRLVPDYEYDLCAAQKENSELLLQCQSLEQHGRKWPAGAAEELKCRELEFTNQLISKKTDVIKLIEDGLSNAQVELNGIETDLKEEMKCTKEFTVWLEGFKGLQPDTTKLSDGVLQENGRITGVIQHLTRELYKIAEPKTKQDTMMYIKSLETELQEKKEKNKELLQRMQQIAPSADCNILEEEILQLRETLKNFQVQLKKMQCLVQSLENELRSAKDREREALLLEDQLRSNTAESALSEMKVKMNEKENNFQAALKEIQDLKEKVSKGPEAYTDEIESLKDQVVRGEMSRMKLTKATDKQITSLKACIEDKEECLRKLREQLRRTQKEMDTTTSPGKSSAPAYPLTCGGGSGIVQSTTMLVLQSKNAALQREVARYKKKCHQCSRNISSYEDELKQLKKESPKTPTKLLSSLHHEEVMSHSNTDLCRATAVSPSQSERSTCHITSPDKTGIQRKRDFSPNKVERHSVPAVSPGNTGLYRKRLSPRKTDRPLLSALIVSPCKKQKLPENTASPKDKFFDVRSESMPYYPTTFFDNSNLGTLSDPSTPPADGNPSGELDKDLRTGATTETNDGKNWWDRVEKADECKTS